MFLGTFRKDLLIVAAMAVPIALSVNWKTAGIFGGLVTKGVILLAVYLAAVMLTGQLKDVRSLVKRG